MNALSASSCVWKSGIATGAAGTDDRLGRGGRNGATGKAPPGATNAPLWALTAVKVGVDSGWVGMLFCLKRRHRVSSKL